MVLPSNCKLSVCIVPAPFGANIMCPSVSVLETVLPLILTLSILAEDVSVASGYSNHTVAAFIKIKCFLKL
jgi:hypothetical protein